MSTPTNKRWFTLVEVMLALTILAMIGLVIGTSLGIFINGYSRSQRVAAELERNLAIDRFANQVLANLAAFHWRNDDTLADELIFLGDYEELWLAALRLPDAGGKGAFIFGRLYVEEEELRFDWSPYPLLPWQRIGQQKFTTEVLAAGVERIEFRYAVEENDEILWLKYWDDDTYEDTLPLALELIVHFSDGSREQWLRRRIDLTISGGG